MESGKRQKKSRKVENDTRNLPLEQMKVSKNHTKGKLERKEKVSNGNRNDLDPDFELVNSWDKLQKAVWVGQTGVDVWYTNNNNSKSPDVIKHEIQDQLGKEASAAKEFESVSRMISTNGMSRADFFKEDTDNRNERFGKNFSDYHMITSLSLESTTHRVADIMFNSKHLLAPEKAPNPSIEEVDKNYVSDFLREARGLKLKERECCYGKQECVSMKVKQLMSQSIEGLKSKSQNSQKSKNDRSKFVCREWLTPAQSKKLAERNIFPEQQQPCILCSRYITEWLHNSLKRSGMSPGDESNDKILLARLGIEKGAEKRANWVQIHDHVVKIGKLGQEYDPSCYSPEECIVPPKGRSFYGIFGPVKKFDAYGLIPKKVIMEGETGELTEFCAWEEPALNFL